MNQENISGAEVTPRRASEVLGYKDPYQTYIEQVEKKEVEPVTSNRTLIIDVDNNQNAFRAEGAPLKLTDGQLAYEFSKANDQHRVWGGKVHTIDFHGENNISFAEQFDLPPYITDLRLDSKGEVTVVNTVTGESYPFRNVDLSKSIHSYEDVQEYLGLQRDFRLFTSAILKTKLSGVGQTLWEEHAHEHSERDFINGLDQSELVINKGQFDKSDSYSGIIAGNGKPVMLTVNNGRGLEETNESAGSRIAKMINSLELDTIAVRGLASFHCDLFTLEALETMKKVQKIENRIRANENMVDIFNEMTTHLLDQGAITEDQVDEYAEKFLQMYEVYNRNGLKLNPELRIVFIADESDPVRLPGVPEAVQQDEMQKGIDAYIDMKVEVINSTHIIQNAA